MSHVRRSILIGLVIVPLAIAVVCLAVSPSSPTTAPASPDAAALRDAGIVALNGLHDATTRAAAERDAAQGANAELTKTNTVLRDRLAQLEASTRPVGNPPLANPPTPTTTQPATRSVTPTDETVCDREGRSVDPSRGGRRQDG